MNDTKIKVEFNGVFEDIIKLYSEEEALNEFDSKEEWLKDSFHAIEELWGLCDFSEVISDMSFIDANTGKEYKRSDYNEDN